MRSFREILIDVTSSCSEVLNISYEDIKQEVIESATKIYIAELQKED